MTQSDETRRKMEEAGWELATAKFPGVYVRNAESIKNHKINWKAEPTLVLAFMDKEK